MSTMYQKLGCYAASSSNFLATFRFDLQVPSSGVVWNIWGDAGRRYLSDDAVCTVNCQKLKTIQSSVRTEMFSRRYVGWGVKLSTALHLKTLRITRAVLPFPPVPSWNAKEYFNLIQRIVQGSPTGFVPAPWVHGTGLCLSLRF